jgi:hypothetical protein
VVPKVGKRGEEESTPKSDMERFDFKKLPIWKWLYQYGSTEINNNLKFEKLKRTVSIFNLRLVDIFSLKNLSCY